MIASARRLSWIGEFVLAIAVCGTPALAQTGPGAGLPSGFTAPGLPFGPTATVPTVASPTPVMAIANPGGLSFGGGSSVAGTGLGTLATSAAMSAGGLNVGGGGFSSAGTGTAGGLGPTGRQPGDDVIGSVGSGGGGGAPAGAGISGGGLRRSPTDAYFDPLAGSAFR